MPSPAHVHELNGVAERYNRSVMDVARCLYKEANISKIYWPEFVKTATYLKNRTIANTIINKTPYEIFFGIKPSISNLRIYGSKTFVRIPEVSREGKWDNKSVMGVLVGYTHYGYRVLIDNKIKEYRHVKVIDKGYKMICLENIDENEYVSDSEICIKMKYDNFINDEQNENLNDEVFSDDDASNLKEKPVLSERRVSTRVRTPVQRYGDPITHCIYVNYSKCAK